MVLQKSNAQEEHHGKCYNAKTADDVLAEVRPKPATRILEHALMAAAEDEPVQVCHSVLLG
jgi:hypothetical protein